VILYGVVHVGYYVAGVQQLTNVITLTNQKNIPTIMRRRNSTVFVNRKARVTDEMGIHVDDTTRPSEK
jgi:hypothetical protein